MTTDQKNKFLEMMDKAAKQIEFTFPNEIWEIKLELGEDDPDHYEWNGEQFIVSNSLK